MNCDVGDLIGWKEIIREMRLFKILLCQKLKKANMLEYLERIFNDPSNIYFPSFTSLKNFSVLRKLFRREIKVMKLIDQASLTVEISQESRRREKGI